MRSEGGMMELNAMRCKVCYLCKRHSTIVGLSVTGAYLVEVSL